MATYCPDKGPAQAWSKLALLWPKAALPWSKPAQVWLMPNLAQIRSNRHTRKCYALPPPTDAPNTRPPCTQSQLQPQTQSRPRPLPARQPANQPASRTPPPTPHPPPLPTPRSSLCRRKRARAEYIIFSRKPTCRPQRRFRCGAPEALIRAPVCTTDRAQQNAHTHIHIES